jgi:uncharacterized protein (DUF111 family)
LPTIGKTNLDNLLNPSIAILISLVDSFVKALPVISIEKIGYGAGQRDFYYTSKRS